ncbi:MAG: phosphotransferase [Acidisphaera sp.]|nr:phosphotransferase [Acidisphaera sp.]
MLDRSRILSLIPHQGRMCLLDRVEEWGEAAIVCSAVSHLDPANPLRRDGRLGIACGIEYGLQAAAVHGALCDGAAQAPGYLASLRSVRFAVERLDDPWIGRLAVHAEALLREPRGMVTRIALRAADGRVLLEAKASIVIQPLPTP